SFSLSNYLYALGFSDATYNVFVWVKEANGQMSTLTNSSNGTDAEDKASIDYESGSPALISDIQVYSNDAPSSPPTAGDLSIALGNMTYIYWEISDDKALPGGAVTLYYL